MRTCVECVLGCVKELAAADAMEHAIKSQQYWGLSPYLQLGVLSFHVECAAPALPKIEFPRRLGEANQLLRANTGVWEMMMKEMPAATRQLIGNRSLLPTELAPLLRHLLSPSINHKP
jgi:hypothetical protein